MGVVALLFPMGVLLPYCFLWVFCCPIVSYGGIVALLFPVGVLLPYNVSYGGIVALLFPMGGGGGIVPEKRREKGIQPLKLGCVPTFRETRFPIPHGGEHKHHE